jgi:hypothetical protein
MDPLMIRDHLALSERHVALGQKHIARQIEIIAEIRRAGGDPGLALQLLDTFRDLQVTHIEHRDRMRNALE